jgi:hypothetical protein
MYLINLPLLYLVCQEKNNIFTRAGGRGWLTVRDGLPVAELLASAATAAAAASPGLLKTRLVEISFKIAVGSTKQLSNLLSVET